jgi:NADPH-dependent 2,4-dienoyl-CoA reductase/sulfur reductase-like enzyme
VLDSYAILFAIGGGVYSVQPHKCLVSVVRKLRMMSKRVVVIGGGVAGLSAAHELIDRGYEVIVVEGRSAIGGKARTQPVPGTGTSGRKNLPGEHGFLRSCSIL